MATSSVDTATLVYCSDQIHAAKWSASASPAIAKIARSRRDIGTRSRELLIAASASNATAAIVSRDAETAIGPAPLSAKRAKIAAEPTASCAIISVRYGRRLGSRDAEGFAMRRFFIILLGLGIMSLVVFQYWHPASFTTASGFSPLAVPVDKGQLWFMADRPRAGSPLHKGDLVELGALSKMERWRLAAAPYGYQVPVHVRRGNQDLSLRLVAKTPSRYPVDWFELLTDFVWIALATIIAARKPNTMTVSFLAFTAFLINYAPIVRSFGFLNDAAFAVVAWLVPPLIATFPNFFLALFAINFPSGLNRPWRRYAAIVIYVAMAAVFISDAIWLSQTPMSRELGLGEIWIMAVGVFAIAIASYIQATAAERPRIGLVLAGLTISIGATTIFDSYFILTPGTVNSAFVDAMRVVSLALPLSVAYAVLRYRVNRHRFCLESRTAAYGITSVVLIALFVLRWNGAPSALSRRRNHIESALIDLGIALIVVFSFRFVHVRVDQDRGQSPLPQSGTKTKRPCGDSSSRARIFIRMLPHCCAMRWRS